MKFICDDNLGKLAKFLRILGFDTAFDPNYDDKIALRTASSEERLLISRDNKLAIKTHPHGILLINHDDPIDQLLNVIHSLKLKISPENLFLRCSLCNSLCEETDKQKATNEVFPYILKTQDTIKKCPSCRRYYWKGTHYDKILNKLKSAIPDENLTGDWPL